MEKFRGMPQGQISQYYALGVEDSIELKDLAKLAVNLRGLLRSEGWTDLEINKFGPMYSLSCTPDAE